MLDRAMNRRDWREWWSYLRRCGTRNVWFTLQPDPRGLARADAARLLRWVGEARRRGKTARARLLAQDFTR